MGDADEFRLEQGLLGNAIKGLLAGCVTAGSAAEKKNLLQVPCSTRLAGKHPTRMAECRTCLTRLENDEIVTGSFNK